MTKAWVSVFVALALLAGFATGFAVAIKINPETADVYLLNLGSVGDWFSGFGALAAVLVTLWLSDKQRRENTEQLIVEQTSREEGLLIKVVSSGNRPSLVTGLHIGAEGSDKKVGLSGTHVLAEEFPVGRIDFGELISVLVGDQYRLQIARSVAKTFGSEFTGLRLVVTTSLGRFYKELDPIFVEGISRRLRNEQQSLEFSALNK
jgi:hypothetical protein